VLKGLVGSLDGKEIINGNISGRPEDAEELGLVLAEDLLSRGADRLLAAMHAAQD
jgi:hydroxymethylbilane synthase